MDASLTGKRPESPALPGGPVPTEGGLGRGRKLHFHNRVDRSRQNKLNILKFWRARKRTVVSAILLGAGESRRMGVNKLLLPWRNKTIFEHCLEVLLRSNIREVTVVLGRQSKEIRDRLEKSRVLEDKRVKVGINPDYKEGMSTSIRRGLRGIDLRSNGILIALGDQPFLKTRTVNALIRTFDQGEGEIVVPSFQGKMGHPVILHRRFEKQLWGLRGDTGARSILKKYPDRIKTVRVKSEGVIKDIDTWRDYKKA